MFSSVQLAQFNHSPMPSPAPIPLPPSLPHAGLFPEDIDEIEENDMLWDEEDLMHDANSIIKC